MKSKKSNKKHQSSKPSFIKVKINYFNGIGVHDVQVYEGDIFGKLQLQKNFTGILKVKDKKATRDYEILLRGTKKGMWSGADRTVRTTFSPIDDKNWLGKWVEDDYDNRGKVQTYFYDIKITKM